MQSNLPAPSDLLTLAQLMDLTGAPEAVVVELVELGWLCPSQEGACRLFVAADVHRLRRLARISIDFEMQAFQASIVVDLLERVEALERRVQELRRMV